MNCRRLLQTLFSYMDHDRAPLGDADGAKPAVFFARACVGNREKCSRNLTDFVRTSDENGLRKSDHFFDSSRGLSQDLLCERLRYYLDFEAWWAGRPGARGSRAHGLPGCTERFFGLKYIA